MSANRAANAILNFKLNRYMNKTNRGMFVAGARMELNYSEIHLRLIKQSRNGTWRAVRG